MKATLMLVYWHGKGAVRMGPRQGSGQPIAEDLSHSTREKRYYCFGRVGDAILTVRFSYRKGAIRIFGAGYWRKGKRIYEKARQIHRGADRKGSRRS